MVSNYHEETNGSCGLAVNEIMRELSVEYKTLKPTLNEMFVGKKIKIRNGINGILIFKSSR
ncbi:hypothetical protein [Flavobacterium sp.]|uniref:hypothetical protein n=1 Tax=Flavobacterium sp. TaxID=239 RepID=UPI003D6A750D